MPESIKSGEMWHFTWKIMDLVALLIPGLQIICFRICEISTFLCWIVSQFSTNLRFPKLWFSMNSWSMLVVESSKQAKTCEICLLCGMRMLGTIVQNVREWPYFIVFRTGVMFSKMNNFQILLLLDCILCIFIETVYIFSTWNLSEWDPQSVAVHSKAGSTAHNRISSKSVATTRCGRPRNTAVMAWRGTAGMACRSDLAPWPWLCSVNGYGGRWTGLKSMHVLKRYGARWTGITLQNMHTSNPVCRRSEITTSCSASRAP